MPESNYELFMPKGTRYTCINLALVDAETMPHIFISYAKKDTRVLAEALFQLLNVTPGITAWMDTSLQADSSWARQIQDEIDRADYVVVLLSPDVNRPVTPTQPRSFVLNEIDYAQQEHKPILPVMVIRTKMPVQIAGTQYIDLTTRQHDPDPIAERIRQRFGIAPLAQPIAQPSVTPITNSPTPELSITDKKKTDSNIRAAYIGGGFLLVSVVIAGIFGLWQGFFSNNNQTTPGTLPTSPIAEVAASTPAVEPTTETSFTQATENVIVPSTTAAPSATHTATDSPPTETPTQTSIPSETPTYTLTPSETPTYTPTASSTSTSTPTYTATVPPTLTLTATITRTPSPAGIISSSNVSRVSQIRTLYDQGRVNSLAFAPDSNWLVTVDLNNTIKVWDVSTGNVIRTWRQPGVWVVKVSPDGELVAGGGTDNRIYIWNLQSGNLVTTLQGHTAAVSSLDFNPTCPSALSDCEIGLVSGGYDNRVRLWNIETGNSEILSGHVNPVSAVAFNPNGRSVVSGSSNGAMIEWNISTRRQISTLRGHSGTISTIAFSADCVDLNGLCVFLMVSSGDDRRVLLWDASTGQQIDELRHTHTAAINSLAFGPDGRLLVTGSSDFTVRILDIENDRELRVLGQHTNFVSSVAFSPNGQIIASGSTDETIILLGLEN